MIIVKIQGGLGNQLFQLALALVLKTNNPNETIAIDQTFFKTADASVTPRKKSIELLNIEHFPDKTIKDLKSGNIFLRIKNSFLKKNETLIINENSKTFIPSILKSKTNTFLNGYWQSYKYFDEISNLIKKQFTLKNPLTQTSEQQKKIISIKPVSISVHLRRGDYLTKYSNIYSQLSLDHYYKAIDQIKTKLDKNVICVFVFSDDIEWCKQNFKLKDEVVFIENPPSKPDHEDLFLMSYCTHNIISNSSYSWWAAWLNTNADKIVIAPKNWYKQQEPEFNASIYPPTWTVL